MKNLLFLLTIFIFATNVYANESSIENVYKTENIVGAIRIESLDGKHIYQYNVNHNERFVPASTFKIPNTLIILEEGLIKSSSDIITWDRVEREYALWNQDQTLKTAFQYSCLWCYQRYAKMVGHDTYLQYLNKFGYGNQTTGEDITRFWIGGDLKVSVEDQIQFLRKIYTEELPVQKKHIRTLKNIMLSTTENDMKVWSKTGLSGKDGWYVGYLIVNDQTWFFANHIEVNNRSDLPLRKTLTMDSFKALNIVE